MFFKERNTFINQECNKMVKTVGKDIYDVTKDLYFKTNAVPFNLAD